MRSIYTKNDSPIHISDYMSGKMEGFPSISTACRVNPICIKRHEDGNSICSKCFAFATTARYKTLEEHLEQNFDLLTSRLLEPYEIPRFNYAVSMCRIESFGDIANETQASNYINIIALNPHVHFGWWTKNPIIIRQVLQRGVKLPNNVQIVYSEPELNAEHPLTYYKQNIMDLCPFIDKVFTVYSKEYLKEHKDIKVNCGTKSCASCGLCYFNKSVKLIKEEVKNGGAR